MIVNANVFQGSASVHQLCTESAISIFQALKAIKRGKHALPACLGEGKSKLRVLVLQHPLCKVPQQNQEEKEEEIGREICRVYQESVQCLLAESCGLQMPRALGCTQTLLEMQGYSPN